MCERNKQRPTGHKDNKIYITIEEKKCSSCDKVKPIEDFHNNWKAPDGKTYSCKECRREYQKKYKKSERGRKTEERYHNSEARKLAKERERKDKDKISAWQKVFRAVSDGDLPHISKGICIKCGEQANNYHHYLGYEEKHHLDVIPVCFDCHADLDIASPYSDRSG